MTQPRSRTCAVRLLAAAAFVLLSSGGSALALVPPGGVTCQMNNGGAFTGTNRFVHPNGNDANTGTSPNSAKLTVANAIATAPTNVPVTIHITQGSESTPTGFTLPLNVSLRGGYSCTNWGVRNPGTLHTQLYSPVQSGGTAQVIRININGPSSNVVEGLDIFAASQSNVSQNLLSAGILLNGLGGAGTPILRGNRIFTGNAATTMGIYATSANATNAANFYAINNLVTHAPPGSFVKNSYGIFTWFTAMARIFNNTVVVGRATVQSHALFQGNQSGPANDVLVINNILATPFATTTPTSSCVRSATQDLAYMGYNDYFQCGTYYRTANNTLYDTICGTAGRMGVGGCTNLLTFTGIYAGPSEGNVSVDPDFVAPATYDYRMDGQSECAAAFGGMDGSALNTLLPVAAQYTDDHFLQTRTSPGGNAPIGWSLGYAESDACNLDIYISQTTGNDANVGSTPTDPFETLQHGVTKAQIYLSLGALPPARVHVAAGTYAAAEVLYGDIQLTGGYNVSFTNRQTLTQNPTFETIVQGGSFTALSVAGGGTNILVEGFSLRGGLPNVPSVNGTSALKVSAQGVDITANLIHGGWSSGGGAAGIVVTNTAGSVSIRNNVIDGGRGLHTRGIQGGSPMSVPQGPSGMNLTIFGNSIYGGIATNSLVPSYFAAGIELNPGNATIENNEIDGGYAQGNNTQAYGYRGGRFSAARILENEILGGHGVLANQNNEAHGIFVANEGKALIYDNWIDATSGNSVVHSFGVFLAALSIGDVRRNTINGGDGNHGNTGIRVGGSPVQISENFIDAGNGAAASRGIYVRDLQAPFNLFNNVIRAGGTAIQGAIGIQVNQTNGINIFNNTIDVVGSSPSGAQAGISILGQAWAPVAVRAMNNIIRTSGYASSYCTVVSDPSAGSLLALSNNDLYGCPTLFWDYYNGSPVTLLTALNAQSGNSANVSVPLTFLPAGNGFDYVLGAPVPCSVAQGAINLTNNGFSTDIVPVSRNVNATWSMGAYEWDAACF